MVGGNFYLLFPQTCLGSRVLIQARRVDSVEGGSFMFWEVFFSAGGANTCAEDASL